MMDNFILASLTEAVPEHLIAVKHRWILDNEEPVNFISVTVVNLQ